MFNQKRGVSCTSLETEPSNTKVATALAVDRARLEERLALRRRSTTGCSPADFTGRAPGGRVERKTPSDPLPVGDEVGIASGGGASGSGSSTNGGGESDKGDGGEDSGEAHLVLLFGGSESLGGREG